VGVVLESELHEAAIAIESETAVTIARWRAGELNDDMGILGGERPRHERPGEECPKIGLPDECARPDSIRATFGNRNRAFGRWIETHHREIGKPASRG